MNGTAKDISVRHSSTARLREAVRLSKKHWRNFKEWFWMRLKEEEEWGYEGSDMSKSRVMALPKLLEQIQGDRRAFAKHRAGQNRFDH